VLDGQLAGLGFAVIDGVVPLADGGLPDSARSALAEVAAALDIFAGQRVYVVCHLYGSAAADILLTAADRCSTEVVNLLVRDGGPELVAFAAGPLLPRASGTVSRIELVLPRRLHHD
jgi:hypothetical protein